MATASEYGDFHGFIAMIAATERSRRAGRELPANVQAADAEKRSRARALAALLNADPNATEHYDVQERIEQWIERNPLALTARGAQRIFDTLTHPDWAMHVQIGGEATRGWREGGKSGAFYSFIEGDLRVDPNRGLCLFVPDAVAEYLRQQGRRQAQREMRAALGL